MCGLPFLSPHSLASLSGSRMTNSPHSPPQPMAPPSPRPSSSSRKCHSWTCLEPGDHAGLYAQSGKSTAGETWRSLFKRLADASRWWKWKWRALLMSPCEENHLFICFSVADLGNHKSGFDEARSKSNLSFSTSSEKVKWYHSHSHEEIPH